MTNVAQLVVTKMQELDLEMKKKTVQKTAVVYTAEETEDRKVAVMA